MKFLDLRVFCFIIYAFFYAASTLAQKPLADLTNFKLHFEEASKKTQFIKSDIVQERHVSMLSEKRISKGQFWFKRANLLRIEYATPAPYLMVMNGSDILINNAGKINKFSTKSNKIFDKLNKIIISSIEGNILNNTDFLVKIFEDKKTFKVELTPTQKTIAGFLKGINLIVGKKTYTVQQIEMIEASGDNTVLRFVKLKKNELFSDDLFKIQ